MAALAKKALIGFVSILVLAAFGLEIYTRWPSQARTAALNLPANTRYAVLLFHGSGGKDEPMLRQIAENIDLLIGGEPGVEVRHHVWSPWSDNRLRAGINGRTIARQLGLELAGMDQLEDVRFIVHSAGGYILDTLCATLRENTSNTPFIEMTFLDPMGIRGAWDYTYGYRHYGECADFSAYIFNRDETTPGTNAASIQSWSVDITNSPDRTDIHGHMWPVQYYLNELSADQFVPRARTHKQYPRGEIITR